MPVEHLFIDRAVADLPEAADIRRRLSVPGRVVDGAQEVYGWINAGEDPVTAGKSTLFLTRNRGAFVKRCPGTSSYRCCDYQILHVGAYCVMDCAYCILQGYFHPPVLTLFIDRDRMFAELDDLFREGKIRRIGTGEYTDSLIWDRWTDLSPLLVERFSRQSATALELKTKTARIDKLAGLDHQRKTIVSWSLNTPRVIRRQERGTASLQGRLEAAARCRSWGYPLAFHFDPLVLYDGCEAEYRAVVERLFAEIPPEAVVWISMGTFRFMPALKPIVERRFPESKILYGEFITGLDGKMRYFKPLRIDLYTRMARWIRAFAPETRVYLCMEDDEVWTKSLGHAPADRGGLAAMLDRSAAAACNLAGGP